MKTEPATLKLVRKLYKLKDHLVRSNYIYRASEFIGLNKEHNLLSKATNTDFNEPKINDFNYSTSELLMDGMTIACLFLGAANSSPLVKVAGGSAAAVFQLYLGNAFGKYKEELERKFQEMRESSEPFYNAMIKHP
jgi:hypothetical protein